MNLLQLLLSKLDVFDYRSKRRSFNDPTPQMRPSKTAFTKNRGPKTTKKKRKMAYKSRKTNRRMQNKKRKP